MFAAKVKVNIEANLVSLNSPIRFRHTNEIQSGFSYEKNWSPFVKATKKGLTKEHTHIHRTKSKLFLIFVIIYNHVTKNVGIQFIDTLNQNVDDPQTSIASSGDVAVWIQNPCYDLLDNFKKNIWFINEE